MSHGRQKQARAAAQVGGEASEIVKLLRGLAHARHMHEVWRDWVTCCALAISNSVDRRPSLHAAREAEFEQVMMRYPIGTKDVFARCLGLLVIELELNPQDVLGALYMGLELGNEGTGQFFTPYSLCEVMGGIAVNDGELHDRVARRGFITVNEPAIGGGALVIAFAMQARAAGIEPTKQMHVTGIDIDRSVLLSAYVQLSLLGIPAVLIVGDTLRMIEREHWYTPVHVTDGWSGRLALARLIEKVDTLVAGTTSDEQQPDSRAEELLEHPVPAADESAIASEPVPEPTANTPSQRELFSAW